MSKLLAPNGKPSNLTPEQYKLVRKPEFKAWFGDWEKGVFTDYQKLVEYKHKIGTGASNIVSIDYICEEIDLDKAKTIKSFHKKAFEFLYSEYESANKNNYQIDFKNFIIKFLIMYKPVFDLINQLTSNEDIEITKKTLKEFHEKNFQEWVDYKNKNISKVVDENGEPLVVFHGTNEQFNVFNKKGKGNRVLGYFFTTDKDFSENYGESKLYFLNIKKIKNFNSERFDSLNTRQNAENNYWQLEKDKLLEEMYNGVLIDRNDFFADINFVRKDYVAFEPNQIKLADGTNTTFDGNNPDIRFDEGGGVDYSDFKTSVIGLVKENKVLILKRGSTANWMPNKWSLVGGVVDSGEEPKEAIIRECFEEIGLKPINVSFNHKIMTNDSGEIYYFNGELESENVKLDYENSTFKFIAKDEINNYDFVPYIKEFIIDIFSKKINNNNITFNSGGELNKGLFSQIWEWFGIKF